MSAFLRSASQGSTPISVPPSQNQTHQQPGLGLAGMGMVSPPTPIPSPRPNRAEETLTRMLHKLEIKDRPVDPCAAHLLEHFLRLPPAARASFLDILVPRLTLPEALSLSRHVEPRLKRDFLKDLPLELALHCLSYVSDAYTLTRAALVSRHWNRLLQDETTWRDMCARHDFLPIRTPLEGDGWGRRGSKTHRRGSERAGGGGRVGWVTELLDHGDHGEGPSGSRGGVVEEEEDGDRSLPGKVGTMRLDKGRAKDGMETYRDTYRHGYIVEQNWLHGGSLLATHLSTTGTVVSSLAMTSEHIVVGTADASIYVFDARYGAYLKSLEGHNGGVWALGIYESTSASSAPSSSSLGNAGHEAGPGTGPAAAGAGGGGMSDPCGSAPGWGNASPLVISGGSDKQVSVFDLSTGVLVHSLQGHTSTIRCLKLIPGEPTVITGSRDNTLRVWDVEKGELIRTMSGHAHSVRCLDVSVSPAGPGGKAGAGARAVRQCLSGSYDYTARLWDFDTGECVHVLRGHYHQVYAACLDSARGRAVTGSLDSTIRVWSTVTGECLQLLVGHTSLVGQLQLSGDRLVSGGSDGRVIQFALPEDGMSGTLEPEAADGDESDYPAVDEDAEVERTLLPRQPGSANGTAGAAGFPELSSPFSTAAHALPPPPPHAATIGLVPGLSSILASSTPDVSFSGEGGPGRPAPRTMTPTTSARALGATSRPSTPLSPSHPASQHHPGAGAGYRTLHRLCAHDSSVTALQYTPRFLVSGGNDGRVKLWDGKNGEYVRDLTEGGESVWRVGVRGERCVLVLQREGKTVVEVWGFGEGDEMRGKGPIRGGAAAETRGGAKGEKVRGKPRRLFGQGGRAAEYD